MRHPQSTSAKHAVITLKILLIFAEHLTYRIPTWLGTTQWITFWFTCRALHKFVSRTIISQNETNSPCLYIRPTGVHICQRLHDQNMENRSLQQTI